MTDRRPGGLNFKEARLKKRDKEPSAGFCYGFCIVVCLTFGLASFLMISAWGRFSGVAWGSVGGSNADVAEEGFVTIEVTDVERESFRAQAAGAEKPAVTEKFAALPVEEVEDFGPLPKSLSDFESIVLNVQDDGTQMPDNSMEDLSDLPDPQNPDEGVRLEKEGAVWREHVVKSGQTLSDIALSYGGLTAQDILRANGLKDANRLTENQLLLIPRDPSKIEDTLDEVRTRQMRIAAVKEKVVPLKVFSYVVARGDSLWSISNSQNIELDTLVGSNAFKTSATLRPGAVLRIPNQDGTFYVMCKGETAEAVCKRYGVSLEKLRQVNNKVDIASLKAGDEIFLPGAYPHALTNEKEAVQPSRGKGVKTAKKANAPVKSAKQPYRWPVMGRINSPFGWRRHPITRRRNFHTGIDIKADRGALVRGAAAGKVAYSGWMGGYGKVLVIDHPNGQSTLYAHCSTLMVKQGASVSRGQNVARVGTTGASTGPHLHFEVRNGNSPVNPLKYLK
ncbi:MAG: LysM peptidoglycan-binding domain-containing M23 family metallopeptidase [Fretibacterium sp.]|nr:LysM peptidoglycan-binding domain-containing M23 family metallopeptidase [Fretibacterium sp.]